MSNTGNTSTYNIGVTLLSVYFIIYFRMLFFNSVLVFRENSVNRTESLRKYDEIALGKYFRLFATSQASHYFSTILYKYSGK